MYQRNPSTGAKKTKQNNTGKKIIYINKKKKQNKTKQKRQNNNKINTDKQKQFHLNCMNESPLYISPSLWQNNVKISCFLFEYANRKIDTRIYFLSVDCSIYFIFGGGIVFNATLNNITFISWRSVLLVENH